MSKLFSGTITKRRNGRYWVRAPMVNGRRKALGTYATYEEAFQALTAACQLIKDKSQVSNVERSVASFGTAVLELREKEGVRGADEEQRLWKLRVVPTSLGSMPLDEVTAGDVVEWTREMVGKDGQSIKRNTKTRALTVLSAVFSEAIQRRFISANPCKGVEVRARADEAARDTRTVFTPAEQQAFLTCEGIPEWVRLLAAFSLFTGLRPGELAHNFLSDLVLDVEEPFLYVRFGSKNQAPKGGRPRRVPLLPGALAAIERWLEIRPNIMQGKKNGEVRRDPGLIFVSPRGTARNSEKLLGAGKTIDGKWTDPFKHYLRLAGITDRPGCVWYAWRHTAATSLLEGWWGPPWSIEEVREFLGHASTTTTEGYLHSTGTRLRGAVRRMPLSGYAVVPGSAAVSREVPSFPGSRESGLNRRPALYESLPESKDVGKLEAMSAHFRGQRNHIAETPAEKVARLLREGRVSEAQELANKL